MTPAQTALLNTLLTLGPGPYTATMFEKARKASTPTMTGSDRDKLFKSFGKTKVARAQIEAALIASDIVRTPVEPPVVNAPAPTPTPPVVTPSPSPSIPPTPRLKPGQIIGPGGVPWGIQNAGRDYSFAVVEPGHYRFEVRDGDHWDHPGDDDNNRSELSEGGALGLRVGAHCVIEYDRLLEPGRMFDDKDVQHVMGQLHDDRDRTDPNWMDKTGASPIWAYRGLMGDLPAVTMCGSPEDPLVTLPKSTYAWRPTDKPEQRGVWIKQRWEWVTSKFLNFDYAGERVVQYAGPDFGFVNKLPDYFKFGIYRREWIGTAAVHYRGMRIWVDGVERK